MDNIWTNVPQAGTGDNILPLCKVRQRLRCITVLEESRTTTIAGYKAITTAPAQDGLTSIIFDSVKGYAWTVPNGVMPGQSQTESITRGGSILDS